jgi:hypothetical protein
MDARLMTLLFKKITVAKSEEVKTGWCNSRRNKQVWQKLLKKVMSHKGLFSQDWIRAFESHPKKSATVLANRHNSRGYDAYLSEFSTGAPEETGNSSYVFIYLH